MANTGTKKWKHVKLVHVGGLKPICSKLDVPIVLPGESVELLTRYPAIPADHPQEVKRCVNSLLTFQVDFTILLMYL